MADLVYSVEHRLIVALVQAMDAGIIRTALHIRRREFLRQYLLKERDVLLHQLFLQVLCPGRDDDTFVGLEALVYCREQIRESLARARSGLDNEMCLFLERTAERLGHLYLPLAISVSFVKLGHKAARAEDLFDTCVALHFGAFTAHFRLTTRILLLHCLFANNSRVAILIILL